MKKILYMMLAMASLSANAHLCPCGKLMQYLRMTLKKRQKERLYE